MTGWHVIVAQCNGVCPPVNIHLHTVYKIAGKFNKEITLVGFARVIYTY